jgi:hypothetical protein
MTNSKFTFDHFEVITANFGRNGVIESTPVPLRRRTHYLRHELGSRSLRSAPRFRLANLHDTRRHRGRIASHSVARRRATKLGSILAVSHGHSQFMYTIHDVTEVVSRRTRRTASRDKVWINPSCVPWHCGASRGVA